MFVSNYLFEIYCNELNKTKIGHKFEIKLNM